MRVLGIDPGLTTIGLGLLEQEKVGAEAKVIEWLTIETDPHLQAPDRLAEVARDFTEYLKEARPDVAVIEKLFFKTNRRTAFDVAQARGVLLAIIAEKNIPIIEPTPLELKSAVTGDGHADKKQMQTMVMRSLHLTEAPKPADAADALALALYGCACSATLYALR